MIGAKVPSGRLRTADVVLVSGLAVSAILVGALGGWPGRLLAVAQLATVASLLRSHFRVSGRAIAAVVCVPAPFAAFRQWSAAMPLSCRCLRQAKPAPGFLSLTGLLVLADVFVAAVAIRSARSLDRRTAETT